MRRRRDPGLAHLAKIAVRRCIEVVSDARVKRFWTECPSIRSRSTLYALANEQRANIPSVSQLLDMADIEAADIVRMAASVAELRELAAQMGAEQNSSPLLTQQRDAGTAASSAHDQTMRRAS